MAGPQEIFKQHLIKNEEQPSFSKMYSAHFGEVSTTYSRLSNKRRLSNRRRLGNFCQN